MHIPGWDTNYIYCECACKINLFGKRLYSGSSWALNCLALALLQSELFKQKHIKDAHRKRYYIYIAFASSKYYTLYLRSGNAFESRSKPSSLLLLLELSIISGMWLVREFYEKSFP